MRSTARCVACDDVSVAQACTLMKAMLDVETKFRMTSAAPNTGATNAELDSGARHGCDGCAAMAKTKRRLAA
jgi:hypothetical protein